MLSTTWLTLAVGDGVPAAADGDARVGDDGLAGDEGAGLAGQHHSDAADIVRLADTAEHPPDDGGGSLRHGRPISRPIRNNVMMRRVALIMAVFARWSHVNFALAVSPEPRGSLAKRATLVLVGDTDPMRDEALAYAARLHAAGLQVTQHVFAKAEKWPEPQQGSYTRPE